MCDSPHMKKECEIHLEEKRYGSHNLRYLQQSQVNTSRTVTANETVTVTSLSKWLSVHLQNKWFWA